MKTLARGDTLLIMRRRGEFVDSDISAAWLTSARLSRKGNFSSQAYHSMLNAARLKDRSATIEHARLLWKDGHHRKAIQTLEGAISANEAGPTTSSASVDVETMSFLSGRGQHQNESTALVCAFRGRCVVVGRILTHLGTFDAG